VDVGQYRMSIMALVASNDERLDQSKCVQMALAHDMAEAVVGDITPHDGVSKVNT
jgi:putative hydrolase of HD superfamily